MGSLMARSRIRPHVLAHRSRLARAGRGPCRARPTSARSAAAAGAVAVVLAAALAALAQPAPAPAAPPDRVVAFDRLTLRAAAQGGVAAARTSFWNQRLGWYNDRRDTAWNPTMPLARLWTIFPLFQAVAAIAIENPTPANVAAVKAFSRSMRRYWNPTVGAYAWYPGMRGQRQTFFDDNGWIAIAFTDAYRTTRDPADLAAAKRAYRFIVDKGWDETAGGGTWWDTSHKHQKTSEPLAAAIYVGVFLYQHTRERSYLQRALKLLAWADTSLWNAERELYGRNVFDGTVMNYVQGMMIGAHLRLCDATGVQAYCRRAEELALASARAFPAVGPWAPAPDSIYLRFLLDLYSRNGDPRLHAMATANALKVLTVARAPNGLFVRRWRDGHPGAGLLRDHAASVSLLAWLAAAKPPQ